MRAALAIILLMAAALPAHAQLQLAAEVEVSANAQGEAQRTPAVAYGGGQYLVVWQTGIGAKADLRAARLDAKGASIDPSGFTLSNAAAGQHHPEVAYGGDVFFVVWSDLRNGKDYDVYGARVDATGKVLDTTGVLIAGGPGNQSRPHLTATPSGFFVVWEQHVGNGYAPRGARVGLDGVPVDSSPIVIFDVPTATPATTLVDDQAVMVCQKPRVALVHDQLQVAWIGSPKRTLNGRYQLMGARLTLAGTVLDTTPTQLFVPQSRVFDASLATAGSSALLSWTDLRDRGELGGDGNVVVVGADGKPSDSLITLGTTGGRVVIDPALAPLGAGLAIAFIRRETIKTPTKRRANQLLLRAIDTNGSTGDDLMVSENAATPALVGGEQGKGLVVYTRLPTAHGGRPRIAARLISSI